MIVARRFVIAGRVQGVGFRVFAEAAAAREGVHGFVRNLPDGRVEAVVEGDQEAVDRVEMKLRRGSLPSRTSLIRWRMLDSCLSMRGSKGRMRGSGRRA